MKRKICFVTIAVMVLSLIGCGSKESTDDASAQEEKQNKAKIEEAMENEDYDKAKTLTANDSNYKDLYNNLTERTAKQSALILVAVDIVNEVLKLKLNKEAIGDFMEEHSLVNSVEQVSIGKRAMEWLLQFISKNYTQFLSKDSPKEISNCRGKLENMQTVLLNTDEESGMRLKVTDSEFMKILKEGHFSEKATVLKEWKEMGYLKAQSDRYISRIKIVGDIQVKGYIIQLPVPSNKISGAGVKDYEEVLEERRKRINKPRQVIKDEYVEDDFFSIDDDDNLDFPEDWK